MKNRIIFLLIIAPLFLYYCTTKGGDGDTIDASIDIIFKNAKGVALLDTATQNHFSTDGIYVYNVAKGIKKEVNYGNMTYPHNFYIRKNDSLHLNILTLFVEVDTTLLQLNENITDTIVCKIDRSHGNMIVRKVWYNSVLKWDNFGIARSFTIIK